jgi:hypothetical protein
MERMRGIAGNVRNTVVVSGGGNDSQVTTTHVTHFQINGKLIKTTASPLMINDGDDVLAVGNLNKGIFNALAFNNFSNGITGNQGWAVMLLFGIGFPVVSVFSYLQFSDPFFGFIPKIVSGVFMLAGLYMLFRGIQVFQAATIVKDETQ